MEPLKLPLRMRIGSGDEFEVGTVEIGVDGATAESIASQHPARLAMVDALRKLADAIERGEDT